MHIVVLVKAVPIVGNERLLDGQRVDRDSGLEANGNDEYVLETALKLTETHGGEVTLLTMGPAGATEALRKGLAMGATRAVHVVDDAIAGSCARATAEVLAAALRTLTFDLVFAGADTSDGQGGTLAASIATRLDLPYLSYAGHIEPTADGAGVRIHRLSATGHDVLEAAMPALVMGTQVLGEPRYPSLRGIMAARTKEVVTRSLDELGVDSSRVGAAAATTRVIDAAPPPPRAGATILRTDPDTAVAATVDFLAARGLV